jgi:hypothetical protein
MPFQTAGGPARKYLPRASTAMGFTGPCLLIWVWAGTSMENPSVKVTVEAASSGLKAV